MSKRLKQPSSRPVELTVRWDGPYSVAEVIRRFNDCGSHPRWDGKDYGVYQIYGKHIIAGDDALLYVGSAVRQTFARRFKQHKRWLNNEWGQVLVFLGRIYEPLRHSWSDRWARWERDVCLAESIMIYKYSPHYNGRSISCPPTFARRAPTVLVHMGSKQHKLHRRDRAPEDLQ